MDKRDNGDSRDIRLPSTDHASAAHERERTLRTLKRLATVLGRPVEDFFKATADGAAVQSKVDGKGEK